MIQRIEGEPDQVEFRVVVSAERAAQLAPALAELAMRHDATISTSHEQRPELTAVSSPETHAFRTDMATELVELTTGQSTWVVTKADFQAFGATHKFDGTVPSHMFNTICRELTTRRCLQNVQTDDFFVRGKPFGLQDSKPVDGLRVDGLIRLETELANPSSRISGYGQRSRELLHEFVTELFTPEEAE